MFTFDQCNWGVASDVQAALRQGDTLWSDFRGARIFISGGTGLIGKWILELLKAANEKYELELRVVVMSRNPDLINAKAPHLSSYTPFSFKQGNVLSREIERGDYTHFIHSATDASADLNESDPLKMFDTIVEGARWGLEFARQNSVKRTLILSSGAIYGHQPDSTDKLSENWMGGPLCSEPRSAYAEAKRAAEVLAAIYFKQYDVVTTIARIFAVLGPYLPLDTHFAAGNFIRDGINGKDIVINGDGRACRSYLYTSDLALWLLLILQRATPGKCYNVGSEHVISIAELAYLTSRLLDGGEVKILRNNDIGWNLGRYVPDTSLIRSELGAVQTVSIEDAIMRTAYWYGWKPFQVPRNSKSD